MSRNLSGSSAFTHAGSSYAFPDSQPVGKCLTSWSPPSRTLVLRDHPYLPPHKNPSVRHWRRATHHPQNGPSIRTGKKVPALANSQPSTIPGPGPLSHPLRPGNPAGRSTCRPVSTSCRPTTPSSPSLSDPEILSLSPKASQGHQRFPERRASSRLGSSLRTNTASFTFPHMNLKHPNDIRAMHHTDTPSSTCRARMRRCSASNR